VAVATVAAAFVCPCRPAYTAGHASLRGGVRPGVCLLMGRRGPTRAPDAAKLRRGEMRPSRLNGLEPLPRHRPPAMPKDFDPIARAAWRHAVREMGTSGLITAADTHVFRLYCEAWSRYRAAAELYAKSAPLLNDRGHLTKNPLHQVVRDNADHVRLLARELGLSPAARASLQLLPGA
jgi:P27 family predicted phage terminase small subunit